MRVGDGRNIRIWEDPWLPCHNHFYVQSIRPDGCELVFVSELIENEIATWRRGLVEEPFDSFEARLILSIPLSWGRVTDGWVWHHTGNGMYSVRSGYEVACASRGGRDGPSSSVAGFRGRKIWDLQLPEKIKLMIWSACKGILPSKDNLCRRQIPVDNFCPICKLEGETTLHVVKECDVARAVWLGSSLCLRVSEIGVQDVTEFFETMAHLLWKENNWS
ncbi:hypothetical protein SLE2022_096060 [Rubroshorea leprosula]